MDKAQQLKNAIKYAQEHPDFHLNGELEKRLKSGFYDKELKQLTDSGQLEINADQRNGLQKTLGAFLDPIIRTGVRAGEALGDVTLTGINKISGGALDKYTPEGNLSQALQRAENTTTKVPVLGTVIKPVKDITTKEVVGDAVSTVALGVPSVTGAGALLGAGQGLQNNGSAGEIALDTVIGAVGGKILEHGFKALAPYIEKGALQYGKPFLDKIAQYIPESGKAFMDNLATKVGGVVTKIESKLPSTEGKILPDAVSNTINKGETIIQKADEVVDATGKKILSTTKEKVVDPIVDKFKTKFKTKTPEEILATPETDLYKLGKEERKYYFDHQKERIAQVESDTQAKITKEFEVKTEKIANEATDLKRQLEVAGRDEVLELRPKIRTALGEQSAEYRRLVDEELAPHVDTKVNQDELRTFIENKYADNPELTQAIKNKLGVADEGIVKPKGKVKKGELPTISTGGKDTTIGELYNKSTALKKEISSTANKGVRVYSPDEKLTDDAVSALTDFLKEKGVDLKNARNFWARYAPIRNQLVAEAKPFVQAPTQTKVFASTLKRVASGTDVNNENFIKEVESLVGEKVGAKSKTLVSKLTANEKAKIASEIEAQAKKAEAKLAKDLEMKKISEKEFEVERKASRRNIIKKVFYGFGILIVGNETKDLIGIGI